MSCDGSVANGKLVGALDLCTVEGIVGGSGLTGIAKADEGKHEAAIQLLLLMLGV
jgi:hypothetical protein